MPQRIPRGARSLKRKVAIRAPRRTFLVFCEGTRTEPEYLNALRRQPEVRDVAAVDLRIEPTQGVPLTLVATAVKVRKQAIKEKDEIDEFWCVFDVEWPINHPNLNDAIEQARRNDINLAISNPCFELWLVLHFQDQTGWMDNKNACSIRRHHDGARNKSIDPVHYMDLRNDARARAESLDKRHEENGSRIPDNNPSSGMHRFLATLEVHGK